MFRVEAVTLHLYSELSEYFSITVMSSNQVPATPNQIIRAIHPMRLQGNKPYLQQTQISALGSASLICAIRATNPPKPQATVSTCSSL